MLTPVATVVEQLRALKPFPDQQIMVAAIAGPPTPYTVEWRRPGTSRHGAVADEHALVHCGGRQPRSAVRPHRAVDQGLRRDGTILPVCADDFGPALDQLASQLNQTLPR